MISAHELWYLVTQCNSPAELSDDAWKKLKDIAQAMENEDFTAGKAAEIGEKLSSALGYTKLSEFRQSAKVREDIEFVSRCIKKSIIQFKGIFNRLDESNIPIKYGKRFVRRHHLRTSFYEALKTVIDSQRRDNNNIRISDIAFDAVVFEDKIIERYQEELKKAVVTQKIKMAGLKRQTHTDNTNDAK